MVKTSAQVGQELAEKTLRELGFVKGKDGKLHKIVGNFRDGTGRYGNKKRNSSKSTVDFRKLPFRIPVIEKTTRQAQNTQGYKASASWQTASLLRDLLLLYCKTLPKREFRRRTQIEDAARSFVANIEEGWGRPTTREYLDYLGFSQGSLAEVRGDLERLLADGLIRAGKYGKRRDGTGELKIRNPSRSSPYPPVVSRRNPAKYGRLRDRLREFTGQDIRAEDLTYETFLELINKTDYLLKRSVEGLQSKVIREEKGKLSERINTHWRKNW